MVASGVITLTTDFDLSDPYVGEMKGVILSINPEAKVVDITHGVKPGDVFEASMMLKESFSYFPRGTVHVVVVDPGVGTQRRPIVVVTEDYLFVAPDNGVLWPVICKDKGKKIVHLKNPEFFRHPVSNTFHGRDIFAPVAAHLSLDKNPLDMGPEIEDPVKLKTPSLQIDSSKLKGQVIRVDRFGNLITNIDAVTLNRYLGSETDEADIEVGSLRIKGISTAYGDVPINHELALIGSSGFLEIAVNQGRADERIGDLVEIIGTPVIIRKRQDK